MFQRDVAKGIHRTEDAYTNWYIVEEGGRLTIVDAGLPASWGSLQGALDELGFGIDHVDALIITHGHADHLGFAERLRRNHAVPVWIHRNDASLTKRPLRYGSERTVLSYLLNPPLWPVIASFVGARAFLSKPVETVERFGDEGTLDVPGSPRIVFTPGHTLGHCSFAFDDRDTLIVGDAIVTLDAYTGARGPRLPSRAATVDGELARESLEPIAATDLGIVLPGHGEPWTEGTRSAVEAARRAGSS